MTRGFRAFAQPRAKYFWTASSTMRLALIFILIFTIQQVQAQLHTLPRSAQDSLAAKVLADSLKAKADSVKSAKSDSISGNDTVAYSAVHIRYRNDRFSLSNKALLTYKGSSLTADSIVFYSQENVVEAIGAPLIQDPTNPPIQGYRMRYNLKTKVGEIYYGSSKKDKQTFNGVEVRRQKNGDIYIARGDFSTCDLPDDKHYFFYGRRMILQPKSKVLSGPIVMNIGDVPVAILPMMVMPLGSGRRSGLLQPKFGGDQALGFYLLGLGYYWAINDYTDFMASGDLLEGEKGTFDRTNFNSLFRYNKRYQYSGSVKVTSYLQEFDVSRPAWSAEYTHDQNITPDLKQTLKGNGRFLSDPTLGQRNATQEREKIQQTANASLGYRRLFDWNQGSLNLGLSQDYNLTDSLIDRNIPDFSYRVGGPLFPKSDDDEGPIQFQEDPWYRKLTWGYDNRFNVNMVEKPRNGAFRGDTNTYVGYSDRLSLSGKYSLLQYFNVTPSANLENLWALQRRGDSAQPVQTSWDPGNSDFGESFTHFNTNLALDTRIYGIAQASEKPWFGSLVGIRHTLIPGITYTYAPKIDSNPRFLANPKIGGSAYQMKQQTIRLSLGNEVDLKLAPEVLPIAGTQTGSNLTTSTTSTTSTRNSTTAQPATKPEPYKILSANSSANYNFALDSLQWSDISSTFSLYLTKNVAFTINATHGLYDPFAPVAEKSLLTSPILKAYSFGWRKGIQVAGDFNSGVRIKDTRGFPTHRFDHTPWSADMNYSFDFSASRVAADNGTAWERALGTSGTFQRTRTHQAYGSLKLNPTKGWQMSYDTDYNFSDGRFSKHSFAFHRILHCWDMDFRWTPIGISEGWNFNIRITELPDVKLESSDSKSRRPR
jgi:lipopolysaccharide assembly outer membrane protein LptD (OstA)